MKAISAVLGGKLGGKQKKYLRYSFFQVIGTNDNFAVESLILVSSDAFTVKTFNCDVEKFGTSCKIRYDIEIPLPDYSDEDDLFGHLVSQQKLPLAFHKEVRSHFRTFIVAETQKFLDDVAQRNLLSALLDEKWDALQIFPQIRNYSNNHPLAAAETENSSSFEECFKFMMSNSTVQQLSQIVNEEMEMSNKMLSLIRTRDLELERLSKACENAISEQSLNELDDKNFHRQSHSLAMLNEKFRQLNTTYSHQINALQASQRHAYREFIRRLYGIERFEMSNEACIQPSELHNGRLNALSKVFYERNRLGNIKKSLSCDSRLMYLNLKPTAKSTLRRDECFTIYIGTQMKSMHNARILACDRLSDLCQQQNSFIADGIAQAGGPTATGYGVNGSRQLFDSRRLQLLMSLYRRELTSVVLIVSRNPMHHLQNRTHFSQLCQHSADLHFESLEEQLKQVAQQTCQANRLRDSAVVTTPNNRFVDENLLRPGDVYMTCHSNLSSAQVIFHLVTEANIETSDISFRHACVGGLRNIIRMAARCAIKNITIPLLLVESMNETMTVPWCMSRAELIFKCLKGFLMEVSSTTTNGSAAAAGVGFIALANGGATAHYNINFAVPHKMSDSLFAQIIDLFSAIFHLVPSLSA